MANRKWWLTNSNLKVSSILSAVVCFLCRLLCLNKHSKNVAWHSVFLLNDVRFSFSFSVSCGMYCPQIDYFSTERRFVDQGVALFQYFNLLSSCLYFRPFLNLLVSFYIYPLISIFQSLSGVVLHKTYMMNIIVSDSKRRLSSTVLLIIHKCFKTWPKVAVCLQCTYWRF